METRRASREIHHIERGESATLPSPLPISSFTVERLGDPLVLPRQPHLSGERLAVLAAFAGVAAITLGSVAMASTLGSRAPLPAVALGSAAQARDPSSPLPSAVALVARPSTERIPFAHSAGRIILAVGARGRSVLVLDGLGPARSGSAYQAWLLGRKGIARIAVFSGREHVVPLSKPVRPGEGVGVTLEKAGGVAMPTRRVILAARRVGA